SSSPRGKEKPRTYKTGPRYPSFLSFCRWSCQPAVDLFRDLGDPIQVCVECCLDIHIAFMLAPFTNVEDGVKGRGIKPQHGSQAVHRTSLGWRRLLPQGNQGMAEQGGKGRNG